ncbi:hypothetical protein [Ectobacillus sp. sgz5001026]|uniref:hypothetical protein n=1 Tax=Ectobacillus sp. sgz5001026 TaxID=3242473 RepID=UPI0036D3B5E9
MVKLILTLLTIPLIIIHFSILYFWIFDWKRLVTEVGLIYWIGSIVVGILLYIVYRKWITNGIVITINRRILCSTTVMTIVLGILALMIESIVRSMP